MKQKLLLILTIVITFVVGFFILIVYLMTTDKPPMFFPLNDSQGKYTILKSQAGNVPCNYKEEKAQNYYGGPLRYIVRYEGKHVFSGIGPTDCFEILVGRSEQELESFMGKQVRIKGDFDSSSQQCIQNKCENIFGPYVVLDIDSIKLSH